MDSYAVIDILDNQYLVKPGDTVVVNGELGKEGETLSLGKALLIKSDKVAIGEPELKETVSLKVVALKKSDKIRVATYKSKSRYRKVNGHRQMQTVVEVLSVGSLKKTEKAATKPAQATAPAKKSTAKKAAK